jgi:DNA polymerase III epsilon subunit-like protein
MHRAVGDVRNKATLTSFKDFKKRYLGTSLMHLGISRNTDRHRDLQMEMVTNEIGKFANKLQERLLHHVSFEAIQLLDNSELVQGLKERKKKKLFLLVH